METSKDINWERKRILRRELLGKRESLSEEERKRISSVIMENLLNFSEYSKSEILFPYVSFGSEADTHNLIIHALSEGKQVYCPKVSGEQMEFYGISCFGDLVPGYKGILEPGPGLVKFSDWDKKILILMPGSVFDRKRNRMGYGKGFYDRFLEECQRNQREIVTVALAFSMQVVEDVPVEEHDIKPDYLITENEILGV